MQAEELKAYSAKRMKELEKEIQDCEHAKVHCCLSPLLQPPPMCWHAPVYTLQAYVSKVAVPCMQHQLRINAYTAHVIPTY